MFKLDFTLQSNEERRDYINSLNLSTLTPTQLELCANYILYGKNSDGKSEVDKKNIYINTKYNSYAKRAPESLDALMENPNFSDTIFSKNKIHYKIVKPTIDREKDADIPTMKELWEGIDALQHVLDVNLGKIEDPTVKKLTSGEIYKLKHNLIDIRRGQYYLKDIFKPTRTAMPNKAVFIPYEDAEELEWDDPNSKFGFAPLGLIEEVGIGNLIFTNICSVDYAPDRYNHKAEYIVDFRNPKHVYQLLEHYEELATAAIDQPTSLMGRLVKTIDYYVERANLKDQHYTIIELKKLKRSNKFITNRLNELYGLHHTENYISTIWTQKICGEISKAAEIHYKEFLLRDDDKAWKVCNTCGRRLLRDNSMFVKKSKSSDGLSNRCKLCDRLAREHMKGGKA